MSSMACTSSSFDGRSRTCDTGDAVSLPNTAVMPRSLLHHVGVEADRSVSLDLTVETLHLGFEAGKQVGTFFEHLEIVQHRLGPRIETLAGDDRRNARRVDNKQRGRNTVCDFADRQIVDFVTHKAARGLMWRNGHIGEVRGRELLLLKQADVGAAVERMHFGTEIAQAQAAVALRAARDEFRYDFVKQS